MSETIIILIALMLCVWVACLEWRLSQLAEERDTLCRMLIGVAYGHLAIRISQDRKVTIVPVER